MVILFHFYEYFCVFLYVLIRCIYIYIYVYIYIISVYNYDTTVKGHFPFNLMQTKSTFITF